MSEPLKAALCLLAIAALVAIVQTMDYNDQTRVEASAAAAPARSTPEGTPLLRSDPSAEREARQTLAAQVREHEAALRDARVAMHRQEPRRAVPDVFGATLYQQGGQP